MKKKVDFNVNVGQRIFFLIARIWIGLAFIGMAIDIITQWHGVNEAFVDQLQLVECVAKSLHCRLIGIMHGSSSLFLGLGVGVALIGGLLILVGYRVKIASLMLLALIAIQVVFLHPFWLLEGAERGQAIAFLWSSAVNVGALFFCMGFARKKDPKEPRPPIPPEQREL